MGKHIHAELMAEYAKDAMETDKPWERWQFINFSEYPYWRDCSDHSMCFRSTYQYRRKPKTSRERFEEWRREKIRSGEDINMASPLWEAWKEAERQAANTADKHRKGCGEGVSDA